MERNEIPLGFGMSLAQNPEAMQKFALLNEAEKQKILEKTHSITSKEEMRQFVNSISTL